MELNNHFFMLMSASIGVWAFSSDGFTTTSSLGCPATKLWAMKNCCLKWPLCHCNMSPFGLPRWWHLTSGNSRHWPLPWRCLLSRTSYPNSMDRGCGEKKCWAETLRSEVFMEHCTFESTCSLWFFSGLQLFGQIRNVRSIWFWKLHRTDSGHVFWNCVNKHQTFFLDK